VRLPDSLLVFELRATASKQIFPDNTSMFIVAPKNEYEQQLKEMQCGLVV
jgi:hypothetical protein